MGRKSIYSEDLADRICERIADGESLRSICSDDDMPDRQSVLNWLGEHSDFSAKYARAREAQADHLFEDMQQVADTGNPEDVQRARLRVMTMQWRASKLAPKKYGDKQEIDLNVTMDPDQAKARLAELLGKAQSGGTGD